ncbi:MAG: hypothetical protein ACR2JB_30395 [Bryobacteraceae bacterium]
MNNNDPIKALNPLAADPSLAAVSGRFAARVLIPQVTQFNGGLSGYSTFHFRWGAYQLFDDAFVTRGLHSIKFGFAFERDQLRQTTLVETPGVFSFGSLAGFLTNQPTRFRASFPTLLTPRDARQNIIASYIQDDWRIRPNLTLNFGLRYETATTPAEINGKVSNLRNITDAQPVVGNPLFQNPTRLDFQPRTGFAWDPFSTGKTAIRGAFGIYDLLPLAYNYLTILGRAYPFFEIGSVAGSKLPAGSFYSNAFSLLGPGSFEMAHIEHNPKRSYVMQWNLNIQQQLTKTLTGTIGYVGSRGVHIPFRADDVDMVIPTSTPAGYLWSPPVGSGTTINPNAGSIRFLNWGGDSYYDALQLGITKRVSQGLLFQASYTWAKSIDTSSGVIAGDAFANSISSLDWFNLKLSRALSDFNVGRTLVISADWQIPSPGSWKGPLRWAAKGWEFGGIFRANDGVPFTPTFGTDGDFLGKNSSDPYAYPDRLIGPGCSSGVNPGNPNQYIKTECFSIPAAPSLAFYNANCDATLGIYPQCFNLRGNVGRNSLIGPGLVNLDLSLFKNNFIPRISETFNVQFRAELFNVLNHPNFEVPALPTNTDLFDSSGTPNSAAGLLTSTTTTAREIQFAIKVVW